MPTLRELPKLTDLTLASAIGGGGGTGGGGSTVFGLLLAAGLALGAGACSADGDLASGPTEGPGAVGQPVTCVVDRAALTLTCGSPQASPGTVIVGGQGKRVGLRSSSVSYNGGTGILSANVTVENLSAGPMGTLDGTTPSGTGVRVFFMSGPDAAPTGSVSVNNPTGTGTFTAGSQPYFEYSGILAAGATSGAQSWEFLFAGGATSFTFSVLVSTDVPASGGIMRWAEEPGLTSMTWAGISGWGADGLALFGPFGEVYLFENGAWSSRNDPSGTSATRGTVSVSASDITVMNGSFEIRHWDGSGWRRVDNLAGGPSAGLAGAVSGSGTRGGCAFGFWQRCFNGSAWLDIVVTGAPNVKAATVINGNIVVLTSLGAVWSRDSSSGVWTQIGGSGSGQTQGPGIIFGTSTTSLWTISIVNNSDPVIRHWNGTSWATQAVPGGQENSTGTPLGGLAFSSTDAYIVRGDNVGHGHLWHWDGVSWTDARTNAFEYNGIWARGPNDLYLAATGGRLEHLTIGGWSTVFEPGDVGRAISAPNAATVILGLNSGQIRRYNGSTWTTMTDLGPTTSSVYAVDTLHIAAATGTGGAFYYYDGNVWGTVGSGSFAWFGVGGSGVHDIWAVGALGQIYHLDPGVSGGWSVDPGDLTFNNLYGVWALNPNFAVTVGQGGDIGMWNGTSWSLTTSPTSNALNAVSGTGLTNVWAVGDGGVIVHYDGANWSTVSSGTGQNLRGVWAASATEVYAVGDNKTILAYNGVSWSPASFVSAASGTAFYGISGQPGGQAIIAGDRSLRGSR